MLRQRRSVHLRVVKSRESRIPPLDMLKSIENPQHPDTIASFCLRLRNVVTRRNDFQIARRHRET
jgi:hypothetical protein